MTQWKKGSATLYFQAKKYYFWLKWTQNALQIEAVNKNELTKCYRGELKADEKLLKELYEFLQIHSYRQSLSDKRVDQISLILTIIDRTEERKGYQCRLIFNDSIKSINVQPVEVSQTYFLSKKIQALQYQKKNDRMMMAQFGTELSRKIEQKDQDIKKSLAQQMQGMISALANQIQQKLDFNKRKKENEDDAADLDLNKIEKKLRKKIKKQLKKRKKQKRHRKIEKKKKRKERRKEKQRLQKILQGQVQNGETVPDQIEIPQDTQQNVAKTLINNLQNFPFHEQDPNNFLNVDLHDGNAAVVDGVSNEKRQRQSKKKKKKQKHKHERAEDKQLVVQPVVTTLSHMGKLRNKNRAEELTIPIGKIQSIQVLDDKKEKREKKSKEKKHKKDKKKENDDQVQQLQQMQQAGERQYYKRLEQIRKTDDINKARLARINRLKPMLAAPKQPLTQIDQFNPKYNGQPKYKPFVSINDYQAIRPNEVFVRRIEQNNTECKKIPAIFREDIPSFRNYEVNGSVVRKISGNQYKQMVFDYVVPQTGKHVITMRIIQSKRFYLWFGVVDLRQKDRQQSFNKKNCITFSFRTGHVTTSNKWNKSVIGRMNVGLSVRMQIDKDKNCIVWYISDGRNSIAPIPKLMQKLSLVPYFQMMDVGDEVCFQE